MKQVIKVILFFIVTFTLFVSLAEMNKPNQLSKIDKTDKSNKIDKIDKEELKSRRNALISKTTHKRLSRAHSLLSQNRAKEAVSVLKRLIKSTEKRPHEKARVMYVMGFAYAQDEQYGEAIRHLQGAIDLKALDYYTTMSVLYTLAQVNTVMEKYDEGLKKINEWLVLADEPTPEAYMLKASILAQKKRPKQALEFVTMAINAVKDPRESWLVLAVAMNYELEKFREALPFLEKLTALHPEKKKYWKQLSAVYINLGKDPKALATMELANKADYLEKDSEIMNLVSLLIYGGIPLKAAKILKKAMEEGLVAKNQKNYEILGDAWARAEELETALKAYAVSATMAKDGRIFAKQGRIYLDQENWKQAAHYLSQALKKGKVKNPQNIHMALGVSRFNLRKFNLAKKSFRQAKALSKKLKKQANQWIAYVDTESATDSTSSIQTGKTKTQKEESVEHEKHKTH